MTSQDAQNLTMELGMRMTYVTPKYDFWEGEVMYSFLGTTQMDECIDDIMRDPKLQAVWMDANGCGVISTKYVKRSI